MGETPAYAEKDFYEVFKQFAEGGEGVITKTEMSIFIKKVAGLDVRADEERLKQEIEEKTVQEERTAQDEKTA